MKQLLEDFDIARKRGTSLIGIKTMDPENTEYQIAVQYEKDAALVSWDALRGARGLNGAGEAAAVRIAEKAGEESPEKLRSPIELLAAVPSTLPKGGILFVHNLQMFLQPGTQETGLTIQGIKNLRDEFKGDKRTFLHLGIDMYLPPEINQDVFMMDEPLPTDEQLRTIIMDTFSGAKMKDPDPKTLRQAIDALRGLATYPAEQVTAMSLSDKGLDLNRLWSRKILTIEQTPGLSIWRGDEAFDAIKGYDNAVNFVKRFFDGKRPPKGIMFIDELEKHLAGATGGDLSGVKQDMLGALLVWMQDRRARGLLFMGVAGSGKSAVAKAAGNYGRVPTISFDLAGMQEGIVGSSGRNIRNGLKVVDAVTSGEVLVIATTNSMNAIPPELRRRFKRGTFFFDLPNKYGKKAIWDLYLKRFNLKSQSLPDDDEWTGAEIENCCEAADDFNCSVLDAANFVVPVAKSAPDALATMREMANNTFISATDGGVYRKPEKTVSKPRRNIDPSMN